jgi:DNA-directed RNA polymerase subunit K/omega
MVKRPADMNAFEFAVVSGLRAAQLHRGCTPRVEQCAKVVMTAQHEVAERKVLRMPAATDALSSLND